MSVKINQVLVDNPNLDILNRCTYQSVVIKSYFFFGVFQLFRVPVLLVALITPSLVVLRPEIRPSWSVKQQAKPGTFVGHKYAGTGECAENMYLSY